MCDRGDSGSRGQAAGCRFPIGQLLFLGLINNIPSDVRESIRELKAAVKDMHTRMRHEPNGVIHILGMSFIAKIVVWCKGLGMFFWSL